MKMQSFSNQVKTEICMTVKRQKDQRAFLKGVLLASRRFSFSEIALQTECEAFAVLFPKLLQTACQKAILNTEYRTRTNKLPLWNFQIQDSQSITQILSVLEISPANRAAAFENISTHELAMLAAGCFVMCGSIADPKRDYHLELAFPDSAFCETLQAKLLTVQPPIAMKKTVRKGESVLYLKQNKQIGDALAYFGAPYATFALVELQDYRSRRSETNRRTNCDLANIDKTITAGAQQIADIQKIQEKIGLQALPEPLQEISRVRLENPEVSLRDLGTMCNPPLSRSGVHHRLQRIAIIASQLP